MPTQEQVIEGRDEALLHLDIPPYAFDSGDISQQRKMLDRSTVTEVDAFAALTVAGSMTNMTTGTEVIGWVMTATVLYAKAHYGYSHNQADYALQA